MKKTILSLLFISSSFLLFAQTDSTVQTTDAPDPSVQTTTDMDVKTDVKTTTDPNLTSSTTYNAYGTTSVAIPYRAQLNLPKDYPTATNIMWTQNGDWYHGTYMNGTRYSHIYYNDRGDTYTVSMPIAQTYVPDDVMNRATTSFGPMIYDVTTLRGVEGKELYQVRTLENGQVKAQWINEDGSAVMDPFRSDTEEEMSTTTNAAMDPNVNADQQVTDETMKDTKTSEEDKVTELKIKTETSDGKETKLKVKDGKVKIKED